VKKGAEIAADNLSNSHDSGRGPGNVRQGARLIVTLKQ